MLNLFIGLAIGGTAELTVGCLLVSAKNADRARTSRFANDRKDSVIGKTA